jgi:hypothetical protein
MSNASKAMRAQVRAETKVLGRLLRIVSPSEARRLKWCVTPLSQFLKRSMRTVIPSEARKQKRFVMPSSQVLKRYVDNVIPSEAEGPAFKV